MSSITRGMKPTALAQSAPPPSRRRVLYRWPLIRTTVSSARLFYYSPPSRCCRPAGHAHRPELPRRRHIRAYPEPDTTAISGGAEQTLGNYTGCARSPPRTSASATTSAAPRGLSTTSATASPTTSGRSRATRTSCSRQYAPPRLPLGDVALSATSGSITSTGRPKHRDKKPQRCGEHRAVRVEEMLAVPVPAGTSQSL